MIAKHLIILGVCLASFGCEKPHEFPKQTPEEQAEELLMSDAAHAVPVLKQRLHAHAVVSGGFLLLQDQTSLSSFQAFPSVPVWKADCGPLPGIGLTFFYGPSKDDHLTVDLTNASLSDEQCIALLAPVALEARSYFALAGSH